MVDRNRLIFEGPIEEISIIYEGLQELICKAQESKVTTLAENKGSWKGIEAKRLWFDEHVKYLQNIKSRLKVEDLEKPGEN